MSEKLAEVFEQYDMDIINTRKGRGSTIITTKDGMRILEPFRGSMVRLEQEYVLKQILLEKGMDRLDHIIPNRDGQLFTCDKYRQPYVLKRYFDGEECDMKNPEDILMVVEELSRFHMQGRRAVHEFEVKWSESRRKKEEKRVEEIRNILEDGEELERVAYLYEISISELQKAVDREKKHSGEKRGEDPCNADEMYVEDIRDKFVRHNAQIKKIGRFVSKVKRRNSFENLFLEVYRDFFDQGAECIEMLKDEDVGNSVLKAHFGICHGSFNQHNVIINNGEVAIVHFERFSRGNQLNDLYQFARKVMEKNEYDYLLLKDIIDKYGKNVKLKEEDLRYLYILFSYPEKFWKIANSYYNSNKAFLSPKYLEKLDTVICQEKGKKEMLDRMKGIVIEGV